MMARIRLHWRQMYVIPVFEENADSYIAEDGELVTSVVSAAWRFSGIEVGRVRIGVDEDLRLLV